MVRRMATTELADSMDLDGVCERAWRRRLKRDCSWM